MDKLKKEKTNNREDSGREETVLVYSCQCENCPEHFEVVDWAKELAKKRVAYDGEEIGTAEALSMEQVLPALLPKCVAASLYALDMVTWLVAKFAVKGWWWKDGWVGSPPSLQFVW